MKQCSWFSILKLISMHDKVWHARKWQAEQVASLVKGAHGKDFVIKFVAGTTDLGVSSSSAPPTQENTKDTHMAELRKKAGNAMLLAPHDGLVCLDAARVARDAGDPDAAQAYTARAHQLLGACAQDLIAAVMQEPLPLTAKPR